LGFAVIPAKAGFRPIQYVLDAGADPGRRSKDVASSPIGFRNLANACIAELILFIDNE
jgi:hypothetical protein